MENVLNTYEKEYDKKNPALCFDERPCQLIDDILVPTPEEPGEPKREDSHYWRNGACIVLLAMEPLNGESID